MIHYPSVGINHKYESAKLVCHLNVFNFTGTESQNSKSNVQILRKTVPSRQMNTH